MSHVKAKARYEQIKKYVSFKYSDDDYSARKIKRYYDELWPLLHQPHTDYKSRSKRNLTTVIKSVGGPGLRQLKAVPVPSAGVEGLKVRIKNKQVQIESDFISQRIIPFNKRKLAKNAIPYINELVADVKEPVRFKIQTGNYEMERGHSKETIADEVHRLQMKYTLGAKIESASGSIHKVKRGQQWQIWLNGLVVLTSKNQIDIDQYITRHAKEKKAGYKKNKKST